MPYAIGYSVGYVVIGMTGKLLFGWRFSLLAAALVVAFVLTLGLLLRRRD